MTNFYTVYQLFLEQIQVKEIRKRKLKDLLRESHLMHELSKEFYILEDLNILMFILF